MLDSPDLALQYEHAFDIRANFDRRWTTGPIHPGGPDSGYTSVGEGGMYLAPC